MRLFFISSGCGFSFSPTMTDEDENIIRAFNQLEHERKGLKVQTFLLKREKISHLLPRIRAFRPDIVLVFKGFRFSHRLVNDIKKSGFRVGVWLVDDPYRLKTHYKLVQPYSFVVTQEASCVTFYRGLGKVSFYSPLAVDTKKYAPQTRIPEKYHSDVCFVGSGFPVRITMFDKLAPFLQRKRTLIIGQWWHKLHHYSALKKGIINQPIPPSEVAKYYNGAKIVLNIHRTPNDRQENFKNLPAVTPNNRTFEIAACGAFQLASARKHMPYFYPRHELVTFNGWKDLQYKIDYYLKHPQERKEIAHRAFKRTITQHTYKARLKTLIEKLNAYLLSSVRK